MKTAMTLIICPHCEATMGLAKLASGRQPKKITCPECKTVYSVSPPESASNDGSTIRLLPLRYCGSCLAPNE